LGRAAPRPAQAIRDFARAIRGVTGDPWRYCVRNAEDGAREFAIERWGIPCRRAKTLVRATRCACCEDLRLSKVGEVVTETRIARVPLVVP
jgi:hypothetical protein